MVVSNVTSGGALPAAPMEPKQAPENGSRTPKDNKAATQAPRETRSAVNNTFGKVPAGESKPVRANPPPTRTFILAPDKAPASDPKSSQTGDPTGASPIQPDVKAILETRLPGDISVNEKLEADVPAYLAKAAQDHYNKQKENGEALDTVSKFYLNSTARYMTENGVKEYKIPAEKLAEIFDIDKIGKNLEDVAKAPDFIHWLAEQRANAIEETVKNSPDIARLVQPYLQEGENHVNALRRMQSDYVSSQPFADSVARAGSADESRKLMADAMKTLASLGLNEKEMLGAANTLAENIRSKYTPDAPAPVIDPNTNKPVQTDDGTSLARLPDGTYIAVDKNGKPAADAKGNPWVYRQDGTARLDAGNAYVQYDARAQAAFASYGGIRYMVGPDGRGMADAQGRPLAIDSEGGAPVALDKESKVVSDAAGNKLVFDPATGKAVSDPASGNAVVIDPATKGIVQATADGKIVAAANGDPYAADRRNGGFVKDAAGRYVMISKENAAPGIVPGYVLDANNTKVVVSPDNGKPVVAPDTGKAVIFVPGTNAPELVPLDAAGRPLLAEDGRNIVYDKRGNQVVKGTGGGPNWLVTTNGKYADDGNGHYIGVGAKNSLASPVDATGAPVQNANGQVPLWDPKTGAAMLTADGNNQVVLDKTGAMLMTDKEGKTVVEEKTGLPYLIDPATRAGAVNAQNGRSLLLDTSGAAVEYNADDGTKYLNNPATNTTVKTAEGQLVTIDDKAGMPVAVNADGSNVRNPETGNTVVYNIDGKPAVDERTGGKIEITPDGKAHLIDPVTLAPVGSLDKVTGGLQLYNKDGSAQVDPNDGNKVQIDPAGRRVEVNPATGKFAADGHGNTIILGKDNAHLKTPDGNPVVADAQTGAPVAIDAAGKVIVDPDSGLPRFINTDTGKALEDPYGKASVVADPKTGAPVHVDPKTGTPIQDPATGLNVVANPTTGAQAKGPSGEPIGVLPKARIPVYLDKQNNALTIADPQTGKAVTNPKTGARLIIDPQYGVPVQVLAGKDGSYTVVDDDGRPRNDGLGNTLYLDKGTGRVVIKLDDGKVVDALTGDKPKKVDPKALAYSIPAGVAKVATQGSPTVIPLPVPAPAPAEAPAPAPATNDSAQQPAAPESGAPPTSTSDIPPRMPQAWASPDFVTSPAEQAEFITKYKANYEFWKEIHPFLQPYEVDAAAIEAIKKMPGNEALQNIPTPDLVALRMYTRGGLAQMINNAMYAGWDNMFAEHLEPYIKSIQSALNQMRKNGYAYEGSALRFMKMDADEFLHMFGDGDYFRNQQFLSTSYDPNWTYEGNVKLKYDYAKGVNIESVSSLPKQKEVIIQPDQLNRIESIDSWTPSAGKDDAMEGGSNSAKPAPKGTEVVAKTVDEPSATPSSAVDPDAIEVDPLPAETKAPVVETPPAATETPAVTPTMAKAAGKWSNLGKVLSYAGEGIGFAGGALQSVAGGLQIKDGITNKNAYDIASGALNVASGALAVGTSVAAVIGGAAAAAVVPLAGVAAVFGMVAMIVDILKHKDDNIKFANSLGELYDPLGILREGWHEKAAQAYNDGRSEPDPAPIAHGNLP